MPDDVIKRLQRLAALAATSVGAMAVRELADVTRRADNAALLDTLFDLDVDTTELVADVENRRAGR